MKSKFIELDKVTTPNVTITALTRGQAPFLMTIHRPRMSIVKEDQMNCLILNLYAKFRSLKNSDAGQDLVEYALLCCLIALACITGISSVASALNSVFSNVSGSLA